MPNASERTIQVLEQIVKSVPVGTNLGLIRLMWAMLSGKFLISRGAVHPALVAAGFSAAVVRRSWVALRYGRWQINELIARWRAYVLSQESWQVQSYEGYQPVAIDLTTFWRPRLAGWTAKFFHRMANRSLKGIGFGLVAQVGQVNGHRIPLIRTMICANNGMSEQALKQAVLQQAGQQLQANEVAIHDAGAAIADMQEAGIARYVVRMALNCTARRNCLPTSNKGRPRAYGLKVRPLARTYKGRTIASSPPDFETSFQIGQRTVKVHGWRGLVRSDQKVAETNPTFSILIFLDPLFQDPLVLGTNITAEPKTVLCLYLDRWPVEQIPQAAKQMLGLQRQFVFALNSCQRLPQLALLAANILTFLAADLPPIPTGFWDRRPQRTPGRLRRVLAHSHFPTFALSDPQIRKKMAITDHLPKGIHAHRRRKAASLLP